MTVGIPILLTLSSYLEGPMVLGELNCGSTMMLTT